MGEASSNSDSTLPPDSGDSDATGADVSREPPTQPRPIIPAQPPYQPTYVPPRPSATEPPPQHRAPDAPPPQQRTPDGAPPMPDAGAPRQPATIAMPQLPQPGAAPPDPVTQAAPPEPATYAPPPERVDYAPTVAGVPPRPPAAPPPPPASPPPQAGSEVLRYGPGVPASQAGVAAESVWRTGRRPEPPPRQVRLRRLRRLLGGALTVILLVAAGVVLYLRFFDHPPIHVTGVKIVQQTKAGCSTDVTGRIDTNGAAGTVSYQWVFRPPTGAAQPLDQSVEAGQHAVFVTVDVQGQGGHGAASRLVTLDVLGPDTGTASTMVTISC